MPGGTLEATVRDGRIELEVPTVDVRLEARGRVWVAVPQSATPPLRATAVQAVLDTLRAER